MAQEELTARFSLEDDMSSGLDSIAESLDEITDKFEEISDAGGDMFSGLEDLSDISDSMDEISSACDSASDSLSEMDDAFSSAADGVDELANAADDAGSAAEEMADSASEASDSMSDVASSAEEVADAASSISDSASSAGSSMEEMGASADEAAANLSSAGEQGSSAISSIASALGGAAIAVSLKEIAEAANEMTEAFSNAQKTIVNATGATGSSLSDMSNSMLDAFRVNDESLDDAAGAVGEINTRMGLTGESLTDMTAKFLDFSDVTGQNVVSSVQSASQILNQWGMDVGETGVLMDKLTYTGQKTGISVDNLASTLVRGAGSFKAAGLTLDNTISLLGDFETIGINTTQGVMAMRTAVTKLGKSGGDVKTGLMEAIDEIAHMSSESQAATKATELFGSRAGQAIALGIRSGALSADSFNASLEQARGTMQLTADAGESLSDKWTKAFNNIQSGFTKALAPGVENMSETLSGLADGFGDFLNNNEGAATAIASVTTGVVGATAAFAGLNAVMSAINSIQAGTGILGMLFGGISMPAFAAVAAGIGLVTGAFMEYSKHQKEVEDQLNSETPWTRDTREELESLQAQYDQLGESHQLGSEKAQSLKLQIDQLSQSLEQNGKSVEELFTQMDSYLDSHNSLMDNIKSSNKDFEDQVTGHSALLNALQKGVRENDSYAGSQAELQSYFEMLNDEIGISSVNIEDFGKNSSQAFNKLRAETFKADFMDQVKNQYQQQIDLENDLNNLTQERTDIEKEATSAQEHLNELYAEREARQHKIATGDGRSMAEMGGGIQDLNTQISYYEDVLERAQQGLTDLDASIEDTNAALQSGVDPLQTLTTMFEDLQGVTSQTAEAYSAAGMALESHSQQLASLGESYQQAYDSAKQSFEGQFGLFDEAKAASGYTMQDLSASLSTQQEYWGNYATNVGQITDWLGNQSQATQDQYGEFMDYIATATPEAAATAYDFVKNLDEGNEEYLQNVGKQFEEVAKKREEAAKDLAEYTSDIKDQLTKAQDEITQALEENDKVSEKAKEAGKKVLEDYFNGLKEAMNSGDVEGLTSQLQDGLGTLVDNLLNGKGGEESPTAGETEKEIKFTGNNADAMEKLREIDDKANQDPPEIEYHANNAPALQSFRELEEQTKTEPPEIEYHANNAPALQSFREIESEAAGKTAEVEVTANTGEAQGQVDEFVNSAQGKEAEVKVTVNNADAMAKFRELEASSAGESAKITVTADTSQVDSAIQSAIAAANGAQAKVTVTADISQAQSQLNQIQSLGQSIHPVIQVTENGASNVISQINAIGSAGAAVSPVVITVTDNGTAAAIAAQIASIPTSKTVTVTVNEVGGTKAGKWTGDVSTQSSFYAGEIGPELIVKPLAHYADGTTFSDGMYIAGENGPELITGAPGSTVFPTSETNRIIEALSQPRTLPVIANADGGVPSSSNTSNDNSSSEKHFVIELKGSGSISAGNSGMDKEQVLEVLVENAKPVLMDIIQNEIYEEGDLSYDY